MPVVLVAAAVVAAGAAAGSAAAKRSAEKKAIAAQKKALTEVQGVDIEKAKTDVKAQDLQYYKDSIAGFRELHPDLEAARQTSEAELRKTLEGKPLAGAEALQAQREKEAQVSPEFASLRADLLRRTQENLARGASLGPEFQAELVRTGLEDAGTVGIGGNKQGAVTQKLGTLIGSAGLALEAKRRQEAAQELSLDDMLTQSRQNILGNLQSSSATLAAQKVALFGAASETLNQAVPSVGLRGSDVLGLQLRNLDLENAKKIQKGNLTAQNAISQGAATSAYIQAGNQAVQGVAGAVGGGGGGGGGGFSFSSLFGSGNSSPGGGISFPSKAPASSGGYGPN